MKMIHILNLKILVTILVLFLYTSNTVANNQTLEGTSFSYKNWLLVCDNTGTCRAAGYPEEGKEGDFNLSILLTRSAGKGQFVQAELSIGVWEETDIDKRNLRLEIGKQQYCCAKIDGRSLLNKQQTQALLDAAKINKTIAFVDIETGEKGYISGQGMAAVLLKMDEFQGRVDTVSALIRKGNKSENNILLAQSPSLLIIPKVLTENEPKYKLLQDKYLTKKRRILALTQEQYEVDCTVSEEEQKLEIYPLDTEKALIMRFCWRGAYNEGYAYWLTDKNLNTLQFITSSGSAYEKGQIWERHKSRGLGDCHTGTDYSWNGQEFISTLSFQTGFCRLQPGGFWFLSTRDFKVINNNLP